jgi:hypothetical protein
VLEINCLIFFGSQADAGRNCGIWNGFFELVMCSPKFRTCSNERFDFLTHFISLQALYLLTKYSSFFEEVHIWYYFIAWTQYKSTIMLLWLFCSLVRSFLSWLPEFVCQPLQPSMTSVRSNLPNSCPS